MKAIQEMENPGKYVYWEGGGGVLRSYIYITVWYRIE